MRAMRNRLARGRSAAAPNTSSGQLSTILIALLAFGVVLITYWVTPPSDQVYSDSRWSIHLALSVIREGDLDLDEYQNLIQPDDFAIQTFHGHQYSFFPFGTPLLAVPFVFIYNLVNPNTFSMISEIHPVFQEIIASFFVALTAAVIYLIARLSLTVKQSLFITFIFAFCTSAWSTASRALWQHGPSMLFLSFALYLLLLARDNPRLVQFTSLPLAYAFVIRPTNAIPVIYLSLFILLNYRKYFVKYLLWALLIALPYLMINYTIYGMIVSPYTTIIDDNAIQWPSIGQWMGTLISPSRGLFVYSPVLHFSVFGAYIQMKDFRNRYPEHVLDVFLAAIIISHYVLISGLWFSWWGGHSTGPRLFTDMLPFLVYFTIPAVGYLSSSPKKFPLFRFAFVFSILVSFFMHFRGATSNEVYAWNKIPTPIDTDRARLWDWSDPPFIRGFDLLADLLPPILEVDPPAVHLYCTGDDEESKCKASIEIFTLPLQAFRWEVDPPSGMKAIPARGKNRLERTRITILADDQSTSPGIYDLGKLEISIARLEGVKRPRTISIPVILHIDPVDPQG